MIVKIFGFLDFLTAIIIILFQYGIASNRLLASFIIYLVIKAWMFRGDFLSFLDFCIALYMVLMIFYSIPILTWIASIYLIQKAVSSFIVN